MSLVMNYNYPGNIRELRSILQSSVNLAHGRAITTKFLPEHMRKQKPASVATGGPGSAPVLPLEQVEKSHILTVYNQMGKNKSQTAKLLGIGLNTLRRKLESYHVE
jgi:transcriptional regulator with PAS, ATPase and Fis domain